MVSLNPLPSRVSVNGDTSTDDKTFIWDASHIAVAGVLLFLVVSFTLIVLFLCFKCCRYLYSCRRQRRYTGDNDNDDDHDGASERDALLGDSAESGSNSERRGEANSSTSYVHDREAAAAEHKHDCPCDDGSCSGGVGCDRQGALSAHPVVCNLYEQSAFCSTRGETVAAAGCASGGVSSSSAPLAAPPHPFASVPAPTVVDSAGFSDSPTRHTVSETTVSASNQTNTPTRSSTLQSQSAEMAVTAAIPSYPQANVSSGGGGGGGLRHASVEEKDNYFYGTPTILECAQRSYSVPEVFFSRSTSAQPDYSTPRQYLPPQPPQPTRGSSNRSSRSSSGSRRSQRRSRGGAPAPKAKHRHHEEPWQPVAVSPATLQTVCHHGTPERRAAERSTSGSSSSSFLRDDGYDEEPLQPVYFRPPPAAADATPLFSSAERVEMAAAEEREDEEMIVTQPSIAHQPPPPQQQPVCVPSYANQGDELTDDLMLGVEDYGDALMAGRGQNAYRSYSSSQVTLAATDCVAVDNDVSLPHSSASDSRNSSRSSSSARNSYNAQHGQRPHQPLGQRRGSSGHDGGSRQQSSASRGNTGFARGGSVAGLPPLSPRKYHSDGAGGAGPHSKSQLNVQYANYHFYDPAAACTSGVDVAAVGQGNVGAYSYYNNGGSGNVPPPPHCHNGYPGFSSSSSNNNTGTLPHEGSGRRGGLQASTDLAGAAAVDIAGGDESGKIARSYSAPYFSNNCSEASSTASNRSDDGGAATGMERVRRKHRAQAAGQQNDRDYLKKNSSWLRAYVDGLPPSPPDHQKP